MTQKKMSELFGVQRPAITKHLKNIFNSRELIEESVSSILEHTADDGKSYKTVFYNLDTIIAVGYRVNSHQATKFRIWATRTLKEFIIKGFVLDDERLKQGKYFGKDYFDELLERIREIRASERRFYQKITDIYALSIDYDNSDKLTQDFFAAVQNKLHWAIAGKTAAEINNNYTGCNSKEEVEEACLVKVSGYSVESEFAIYPNPAVDELTISNINERCIRDVVIYN